jgi:hypothetical protein
MTQRAPGDDDYSITTGEVQEALDPLSTGGDIDEVLATPLGSEIEPNGLLQHAPGAKMDAGKARWDLLPWEVIEGVVRVMSVGAAKYSPDGWKSVPDGEKRYFSAMMRHWMKMQAGEYLDDGPGGTGEPHWGCFLTNAVFLSYYALKSPGE